MCTSTKTRMCGIISKHTTDANNTVIHLRTHRLFPLTNTCCTHKKSKWTSKNETWFVMTVIQWASELCLTPGRTGWKHHSWRMSSLHVARLSRLHFFFINVFLKHSYVSTRSIHFYTHTFLSILAFILISSHKYLFLFIVRYIPFDPDLSLCPLSCGLWSPLVLVFYFTVCCLTSKSYPIGCYPPLKVVFYFLSLSAITFLFALYMFLWTVLYGFY